MVLLADTIPAGAAEDHPPSAGGERLCRLLLGGDEGHHRDTRGDLAEPECAGPGDVPQDHVGAATGQSLGVARRSLRGQGEVAALAEERRQPLAGQRIVAHDGRVGGVHPGCITRR